MADVWFSEPEVLMSAVNWDMSTKFGLRTGFDLWMRVTLSNTKPKVILSHRCSNTHFGDLLLSIIIFYIENGISDFAVLEVSFWALTTVVKLSWKFLTFIEYNFYVPVSAFRNSRTKIMLMMPCYFLTAILSGRTSCQASMKLHIRRVGIPPGRKPRSRT